MKLNEQNCTIEFQGRKFTNSGAFVNNHIANVYVTRLEKCERLAGSLVKVTDWHGTELGNGSIISEWRLRNYDRMVSVRFAIDGIIYSGRFNYDSGQLVRAKRVKE